MFIPLLLQIGYSPSTCLFFYIRIRLLHLLSYISLLYNSTFFFYLFSLSFSFTHLSFTLYIQLSHQWCYFSIILLFLSFQLAIIRLLFRTLPHVAKRRVRRIFSPPIFLIGSSSPAHLFSLFFSFFLFHVLLRHFRIQLPPLSFLYSSLLSSLFSSLSLPGLSSLSLFFTHLSLTLLSITHSLNHRLFCGTSLFSHLYHTGWSSASYTLLYWIPCSLVLFSCRSGQTSIPSFFRVTVLFPTLFPLIYLSFTNFLCAFVLLSSPGNHPYLNSGPVRSQRGALYSYVCFNLYL